MFTRRFQRRRQSRRRFDLKLRPGLLLLEVLECRISLINQLENFNQSDSFDLAHLLGNLIESWDDSTCLSASQCILNKRILNIASKYLETNALDCPGQFLVLGTKATKWCGGHLCSALNSIGEMRDENSSSIFFQIILDSLSLSSTITFALTRSPILEEKMVIAIVQDFISELLNLTKASVMEITRISSIASEVLKLSQVILDAAVKLCRTYFLAIKLDSCSMNDGINKGVDTEESDYANHVVDITVCTIKYLYELGLFAASGGGSLVTLLNVSWKGVVSLLQLAKGVLVEKMNVADIIVNLVYLGIESLKCTSQAWSVMAHETLTTSEAKRAFLPIKFYLINAVRISSEYPLEAIGIHRELTRCALLVASLGILFSKDTKFRAASEALAEFLEPTSLLLLHTLLNTSSLNLESRLLILQWLFHDEKYSGPISRVDNADGSAISNTFMSMFLVSCDDIWTAGPIKVGRVMLFLNLLKTSPVLKEEIVIAISENLEILFNALMHEEVYALALGLEIPVFCGLGPNAVVVWKPVLYFMLHSIKTFMIVAASSPAWMEVETFMLHNIFHPHPLCLEIIMEMWCFLVRHGEENLVHYILDRVVSILKTVASSESVLGPLGIIRQIARLVSVLLSYACPDSIDNFYNIVLNKDDSNLSQIISVALLMEGFPLDLLPDDKKLLATRNLVASFNYFIENQTLEQKLALKDSLYFSNSQFVGLPVVALSAVLQCGQVKEPDIAGDKNISQVVNFAVLVIHAYENATIADKDIFAKLLSATLVIVSNMKIGSTEMKKLIVELHALLERNPDVDDVLYQCKPAVSSFMASLSHIEIAEGEDQTLCSAIWDLYHMLLKERHWAIVHLAIVAFGYFAARTSCTELWRFVPRDATLSFDISTATEMSEDRFMSELKCVLEKEVVLDESTPAKEHSVLVQEGTMLREQVRLSYSYSQVPTKKILVNYENNIKTKKRKLLDRISEGMELLQNGLKVMNNALDQSDATDLKDKFSSHISCIEDVVSHLIGLTDRM